MSAPSATDNTASTAINIAAAAKIRRFDHVIRDARPASESAHLGSGHLISLTGHEPINKPITDEITK